MLPVHNGFRIGFLVETVRSYDRQGLQHSPEILRYIEMLS